MKLNRVVIIALTVAIFNSLDAHVYNFRNAFIMPIEVEVGFAVIGRPNEVAVIEVGETATFKTNGACLNYLRITCNGTVDSSTERMTFDPRLGDLEVMETRPGWTGSTVSTLPSSTGGLACLSFNMVFKRNNAGALVMAEEFPAKL